MRRPIIIVLALVIGFSLSIASPEVIADNDPRFCVSSHTVSAGDTVDVYISIKDSPGISSAKILVSYNSDLKLNSVTYNNEIGGMCQQPAALSSTVTLNWMSLNSLCGDALFATLSFSVGQGAATGDKIVGITFNPNDICDIDENIVPFNAESGVVKVIVCSHENTEVRGARLPSLTEPGYSGDVYCTECGKKISEGTTVYAPGDANADGAVNIKDLVRTAKFLSDGSTEISSYADIDDNGSIGWIDFIRLRDIILGLE